MRSLTVLGKRAIKVDDILKSGRRRSLVSTTAKGIELKISPLTPALLADLSEVGLVRLSADPLSKFDTQVALVEDAPSICEVLLDKEQIILSDRFLGAIEFAAAHAALVNIIGKVKGAIAAGADDSANLAEAFAGATTAVHSLYMSRMLLHVLGEEDAPQIASLLPQRHKKFVHQQTAMCLTFALLHEQAHIEFAQDNCSIGELRAHADPFVDIQPNASQLEEHHADIWAVRQVEGEMRSSFLRAASFFFFNQWVIDYLMELNGAEHPPAFNRIQALMQEVPDLKNSDIQFFNIMTKGLNKQSQLRTALNERDQSVRYAKFLKWCRSHLKFNEYEGLVGALCRTYEEMGLDRQPITNSLLDQRDEIL